EVIVDTATLSDGRLIGSTSKNTLVTFDGTHFSPWAKQLNFLWEEGITSIQALEEGGIAIAVQNKGLFLLSAQGELIAAYDLLDYQNIQQLATNEPGILWATTDAGILRIAYGCDATLVDQRMGVPIKWPQVVRWRGKTLIATDGETFGHHHPSGIEVLKEITTPTHTDAYEITTLNRYLHQHPPVGELEIVENSAWSCAHSLGRWATGCDCTPGPGYWKGALRRTLDNVAHELDDVYASVVQRRGLAPWSLRDDYIAVLLGTVDPQTFLAGHCLDELSTMGQQQVLHLLEAQVYRQRMFASCAFFFEDLERIEAHYAIANAVRALALTLYATGDDLTPTFRRDLNIARSAATGRTGAQIMDELLARAHFGESSLGNVMTASRPNPASAD
ncbi:MAG TPA: DUF3536 domain-containing protein, partial [Anaerolineae bacterium]|nr:DUF3536 domain-containing protein [Anaerolineae bacterium]